MASQRWTKVNTRVPHKRPLTALQGAAQGGKVTIAEKLLEAGAEMNAPASYES